MRIAITIFICSIFLFLITSPSFAQDIKSWLRDKGQEILEGTLDSITDSAVDKVTEEGKKLLEKPTKNNPVEEQQQEERETAETGESEEEYSTTHLR